MACLTHTCRDCDHEWFDNVPRPDCPECGSCNVHTMTDERPEDDVD